MYFTRNVSYAATKQKCIFSCVSKRNISFLERLRGWNCRWESNRVNVELWAHYVGLDAIFCFSSFFFFWRRPASHCLVWFCSNGQTCFRKLLRIQILFSCKTGGRGEWTGIGGGVSISRNGGGGGGDSQWVMDQKQAQSWLIFFVFSWRSNATDL